LLPQQQGVERRGEGLADRGDLERGLRTQRQQHVELVGDIPEMINLAGIGEGRAGDSYREAEPGGLGRQIRFHESRDLRLAWFDDGRHCSPHDFAYRSAGPAMRLVLSDIRRISGGSATMHDRGSGGNGQSKIASSASNR
jgi:hypothetical protein